MCSCVHVATPRHSVKASASGPAVPASIFARASGRHIESYLRPPRQPAGIRRGLPQHPQLEPNSELQLHGHFTKTLCPLLRSTCTRSRWPSTVGRKARPGPTSWGTSRRTRRWSCRHDSSASPSCSRCDGETPKILGNDLLSCVRLRWRRDNLVRGSGSRQSWCGTAGAAGMEMPMLCCKSSRWERGHAAGVGGWCVGVIFAFAGAVQSLRAILA